MRGELRSWPAVLLAGALVYGAAGWQLSRLGSFWSVDSAVRFVQLESLRQQGYRSLAVVYPAEDVDPAHRFYPIAEGFSYRRDGRTYITYPWLFPLASAPWYGLLGSFGLILIPGVAALAAASAAARAADRYLKGAGTSVAFFTALASPLVVYGTVFWDHTLLAGLCTLAVVSLLDSSEGQLLPDARRSVLAGLLLGAGVWLRNEAYLFAAGVLGSCVLVWGRGGIRPALFLGMGLAGPTGLLWAYNQWWFGSPLGYKGRAVLEGLAIQGLGYFQQRALVGYDLLLSLEHYAFALRPVRLIESGAVALCVLLGAFLVREGRVRQNLWLVSWGGLLLAAVPAVLGLLRIPVMGLIPSVPFLGFALLGNPREARERFLWAVVGLYTAGVLAFGSVGGLQWGPRYLLPAVPLIGWLAGLGITRVGTDVRLKVVAGLAAAAVGAAGFCLQLSGLGLVYRSMASVRAIEDLLRSPSTEILVTGFEPMFRILGRLYFERKLMSVDSQEELQQLTLQLSRRRVPRWVYVPRFGRYFDARVVERWTERSPWRFRAVDDRIPMVVEFGGLQDIRLITYVGGAP